MVSIQWKRLSFVPKWLLSLFVGQSVAAIMIVRVLPLLRSYECFTAQALKNLHEAHLHEWMMHTCTRSCSVMMALQKMLHTFIRRCCIQGKQCRYVADVLKRCPHTNMDTCRQAEMAARKSEQRFIKIADGGVHQKH